MPVARRKAYYGENPEQSQFKGGGVIRVPAHTAAAPGGKKNLVLETLIPGSPNLGYNWELVNLHIPIATQVKTEKPETSLKIAINVGSQNLYLSRVTPNYQTFTPKISYNNLLFAEAPPISLIVPAGQQLQIIVETINGGKDETEFIRLGYELEEVEEIKLNAKQVESSINYLFV